MGLWLSCFFAIAIIFAPIAIALDNQIYSFPVWLTLFLFVFLLIRLLFERKDDFLYASFLCFIYIFMILAPLLQISEGIFPWVDFYTAQNLQTTWWITAIGLLFFEFGYLAFFLTPAAKNIQHRQSDQVLQLNNSGGRILFLATLIFTLFGLAYTGVGTLFLPRNQASILLSEASGGTSPLRSIISSLMRVPPAIILLIFLYDFYSRYKNRFSGAQVFTPNTVYMCLIGIVVAVVNNPISTARFWVGAIALSVVLLFIFVRKKNTAFFWFSLNLSIVVLVFPISDIYRKSLEFNLLEDKVEIKPTEELVTSPDFDAFQQQMNVTIVVEQSGLRYGNQFLSSMLFFVPRNFWPGKSEPTGRYVADELNYRFGNLSTPITAEFYIDGGMLGVVVGMFLLGMLYRYAVMLARGGSVLIVTMYCFFASYQFYLLRGSLMTVTNYLLVALSICCVIYFFKHLIFVNIALPNQNSKFFTRVYP